MTARLVPADLLSGGEIIVLAIKPSGWFILLASLPVIALAVVAAAVTFVVDVYRSGTPAEAVMCLCAVAALIRVTAACWQWLGRTYVLTNRRIVTVRGLIHPRITTAALSDVRRAVLAATVTERLVGVGTIYCLTDSENAPAVTWNALSKPTEIHEIVMETIERAK